MSRDVITDSPSAEIRGPNNTDGNHHTNNIPTVKLSSWNDSNEGESDSSSDDLAFFYGENAKLTTNANTAETVQKMPLLQAMSIKSNASTASSEFSNLSIGNRKSSIESSTCSESDSEGCTKVEIDAIEDITQILGELKVTPKGSEKENNITSSIEKDIANLLTETSELKLNDELDNAKYHVGEERTLSRDRLDNTESQQRFRNANRQSDNTNVSDENEDSDSSEEEDEHSSSDSEDSDTYLSRGIGNIRSAPYRRSDSRVPVQRREEIIDNQIIEQICAVHSIAIDQALNQIRGENLIQIPEEETSESATDIANSLFTSHETSDVSRTRDPPNLTTQPTYTVHQPQSSAPNHFDGFPVHSPESNGSFADQSHDFTDLWTENNSLPPNGQRNYMTYGMEKSPLNGSLYSYSPSATNSSGNHSPESLRSEEDISVLNSVEQSGSLDFFPTSEINKSENLKMTRTQIYADTRNFSLENYGTLNGTSQSSRTDNTITIAGYWSQTNYNNVVQLPTNQLNSSIVNNTYSDSASNTASPILDRLSPNLTPPRGTVTDNANHLSLNNLNSDSDIQSHRINGCIDSVGFVTFGALNKFHEPSVHSTSNGNVEKNNPSLRKDSNVVQDQKILTKSNEEDGAWNNKPNTAQPRSLSNDQLQNTIPSSTSEPKLLIPTTVKERTPIPETKPGPPRAWPLLNLPSSAACEQLQRVLNEKSVKQAILTLLPLSIERYSQTQGSSSDTLLMALVREPTTLEKRLSFLLPIVHKMMLIPRSFMAKDERGQDALYLAAMNCPNRSYVAGYLAIIIAEFCKNNTIQLNTYNKNRRDTLMHVLAAQGDSHLAVMEQLSDVNKIMGYDLFDLSAKNGLGETPLETAKAHQTPLKPSILIFRWLMENGPNSCLRKDMFISPARSRAIVHRLCYPNVDCGTVNVKN